MTSRRRYPYMKIREICQDLVALYYIPLIEEQIFKDNMRKIEENST